MKKKVLIIVDPQIDFISGSLGVAGAKKQMELLTDYITYTAGKYNHVIVTLDSHPIDHCSFTRNGGQWKEHCVKYTEGFLPFPILMENIFRVYPAENITMIEKGTDPEVEEYSALDNVSNADTIMDILESEEGVVVDIAGIMSEYCVLETIKGILDQESELNKSIRVLIPFIATMDNNETLKGYCKENEINIIEDIEL